MNRRHLPQPLHQLSKRKPLLFKRSIVVACIAAAGMGGSAVAAFADDAASTMAQASTAPDYRAFLQAGYTRGKVYSELSAGHASDGSSFVASGAYLWFPFAIKLDARQDEFTTSDNTGFQGTLFPLPDGTSTFIPQSRARQSNIDARVELQLLDPHIYLGAAYLETNNNYGFPKLRGVGLGLEKLPDFDPGFGVYFSAFYYPTVTGKFTASDAASPDFGRSFTQQYRLLKYDLGIDVPIQSTPLYIAAGFGGDRFYHRHGATVDQTHAGPYAAIGVRF